jgi:hypothetical protein
MLHLIIVWQWLMWELNLLPYLACFTWFSLVMGDTFGVCSIIVCAVSSQSHPRCCEDVTGTSSFDVIPKLQDKTLPLYCIQARFLTFRHLEEMTECLIISKCLGFFNYQYWVAEKKKCIKVENRQTVKLHIFCEKNLGLFFFSTI